MNRFGEKSEENVLSAHPYLQLIAYKTLEIMDISCTCGVRDILQQKELLKQGKTKTLNSFHLPEEFLVTYELMRIIEDIHGKINEKIKFKVGDKVEWSRAIDIQPYPISWDKMEKGDLYEMKRFSYMCGIVRGIGKGYRIPIKMGIDWNDNGFFSDQTFHDLPHVQLFL